jgi:molybdopterin converting factor subunit 1
VTIRVRLFATLRERAGRAEESLHVDGPMTVGQLWDHLRSENPGLAEFPGRVAFAVNQEYVDSRRSLRDDDEVAFIPPVSGGS